MDKFPLKLSVVQLRLATKLRVAGRAALIAAPFTGALLMAEPALAKKGLKTDLSSRELAEARQLDWVPIEELTAEQKKNVPDACCGAFIAPVRTDVDVNTEPEKAPLRATADESHSDQQTQMTLTGKVNITQGARSLVAENAHMDQETRNAELAGGIELREPGLLIRADKARMNLDSGDAQLDNARFVLYESRVHGDAQHLNKFGDNIVNLDHSQITSCEPGDNSWSVEGSDITLYPDKHYGTARNMRLNIRDVPVMYMPYARFPLGSERLTGFLFPSVGYSSNRNEMDVAAPFYWNIAPNYDATITPRYISGRGSVLELETRHLSSLFESKFTGSHISKDRGGYDLDPESVIEPDPPRGSERWYYKIEQQGGKGQAWSTNIDYSDISDNNFLRDMNYGSVDSNRQAYLHQTASVNYQTLHWSMGARADEYRLLTVNQNPYRELPRVHLNGNYRVDDWVFKINNEYVNFVKNRYYDISADNIIFGERENTDYSVAWDKHYPSGFIRPSIGVRTLTYQLNDEKIVDGDSSPNFAVPQVGVDSGLYFDRDTNLFGGSYVQTLEPRAFYFYSKYQNQDALQGLTVGRADAIPDAISSVNFDTTELPFNYDQLFRTTRFAGGDRLDDANQISLAVSTAFISQSSGSERLRFSLGQTFYAEDREISVYGDADPRTMERNSRSSSNLAAKVSGRANRNLLVSADAAYDQHDGELDNASLGIHYIDDAYRIANISYRYTVTPVASSPSQPAPLVSQPLNQIDASALWPVAGNWSIIARSNYDFKYGVELDTFAGLEYDDCCYRIRLMGRHWLDFNYYNNNPNFLAQVTSKDYETGFMFELQFKGLASTSQRISTLLDKAISGFTEREENLR